MAEITKRHRQKTVDADQRVLRGKRGVERVVRRVEQCEAPLQVLARGREFAAKQRAAPQDPVTRRLPADRVRSQTHAQHILSYRETGVELGAYEMMRELTV